MTSIFIAMAWRSRAHELVRRLRAALVVLARAPVILPWALIAGWIYPEWIILGLAIGNEHEVTGYALIQAIAAGSSVACLLWAIVARPRQDGSPDAAAKAWTGALLAAAAWGVIVVSEIAAYS